MRKLILMLALALACAQAGAADTLARVKETHELRLGYFEGSAPFSFTTPDKAVRGYSVELCERVAAGIGQQLGVMVKIVWVPLALGDRIEAVRNGRIDIECGTTTWTFSRQQLVDFSLVTFIDGASLLVDADSDIHGIADVGGKRIAVIRGTTTERSLVNSLERGKLKADITRVDSREQGLAMLAAGHADAFASDRFLLMNALAATRAPRALRVVDQDFSIEPYALVLPRGDYDFRVAVNRVLAATFRSGDIMDVYDHWLAQFGQPSLLLSALYYLQAVPE